jgi:hypothetical protein|tara:strand:+ start:534 stop:866 length:333 start_codon:yes stop_codon:yes gene_type:complete
MEDLPYKIGTIKLTWITPSEFTILKSKMFDSVDEALKNIPKGINKEDFMIFKLIKTDGTAYEWKLLPYGNHSDFVRSMEFRDNKLYYYGTMGLGVLGAFYLLKLLFFSNK